MKLLTLPFHYWRALGAQWPRNLRSSLTPTWVKSLLGLIQHRYLIYFAAL